MTKIKTDGDTKGEHMFELRDYQKKVIEEIREKWRKGEREVVLGACPNSGKTEMAISLIKNDFNNKHILILAHGTNVIKNGIMF